MTRTPKNVIKNRGVHRHFSRWSDIQICARSARKFYSAPPRFYCAPPRSGALYIQVERYKIFARNQKCHSASELGLGRIYFFCQMPICRIIWLFLVGYRISGRIIRQCRISGSTLLLNRGFTYLPASLIKIENRVSLSPADPDFYLHVYKKEVYRP